jgi:hypothetical protein
VNAGSGAARVVVDGVVPAVLVDAVCAGVVAVPVVFAVVAAVCVAGGALDAVTVFVDEPHAASSAAAHAHSAAVEIARVAVHFIVPMVFAARTRHPRMRQRMAMTRLAPRRSRRAPTRPKGRLTNNY